jgi:hypothetical protein
MVLDEVIFCIGLEKRWHIQRKKKTLGTRRQKVEKMNSHGVVHE